MVAGSGWSIRSAYVLAVAEEGSFTRAAEREHVAQPGVSAQVRKLEAELGQPWVEQWFLTALADFHRRHPDVEISPGIEATSMDLLGGVRSGRSDLALAGLATTTPAGLESILVTRGVGRRVS